LPKIKYFLKLRGLKVSKQKSKIINLKEEVLVFLDERSNYTPPKLVL
jgi:hypothetical protein